jgi:uncharacterized Ntn-hydrolase superfamily protein
MKGENTVQKLSTHTRTHPHRYPQKSRTRPISTYSIIAFDEKTGELGVAVQSHWFSVGRLVPWAKSSLGAVATQSFVRVEYGPEGLELMEKGHSAEEALKILLKVDDGEAVRQVAMMDTKGSVAAHTGDRCVDMAGHYVGSNYSVQANMMEKDSVWPAMAKAFEGAQGDLANRMMASLEAAEGEGGDIRGRQSAAMLIVSGKPTGIPWEDTVLDLRIEDHPAPLDELKRLIRVNRAYQHANKGDVLMEEDKIDLALKEFEMAGEYYPENPEFSFWTAVALADKGQLEKALPIFRDVFQRAPNFRVMTPRLVKSELLRDDNEMINKIISQ